MNETTRGAYAAECDLFMQRWNAMIEAAGYPFRFTLPSRRFRRGIGVWAHAKVDLAGRPICDASTVGLFGSGSSSLASAASGSPE